MMKYLFFALLLTHGSIHLIGFLKAFELARIEGLDLNIDRPAGLGWLIASMMFVLAALLFLLSNKSWTILALAGTIISLVLIAVSWQEARYGLIINLIIFTVAAMWFGMERTETANRKELEQLRRKSDDARMFTQTVELPNSLPEPVLRWLKRSGITQKPQVNHLWIKQVLKMKLKPTDQKMIPASAGQYVSLRPTAFFWKVKLECTPFVQLRGRDILTEEMAEMHIQANGLFNIVKGSGPKIYDGSMIRYLGEMVWYPWYALEPGISWQAIDSSRAKAIMTLNGRKVEATYRFDELGRFRSLTAMRYMGESDIEPKAWVTEALEWNTFQEIELPSKVIVSWILPEGKWTWLQVHVTDIKFGGEKAPDGFF